MKDYSIDSFSLPCECGGTARFKIIIGTDQDETVNNLGFICACDTCDRASGMTNEISEAYSDAQNDVDPK